MVGVGDTGRVDPYRNFRFKLRWDGRHVAGFSRCSTLEQTSDAVAYQKGRNHSSSAPLGSSNNKPITLERGITQDSVFEQWARNVAKRDGEISPDARKDVFIEVYNEAGQLALAYEVFRSWISAFQAIPDLDANANAVAIQHMQMENEGWERASGPTT